MGKPSRLMGLGRSHGGEDAPVDDLVQQRSMLLILIAACKTAQTAFQAARNTLDVDLLEDLDRMIKRSERELESLSRQIDEAAS